MTEEYFQSKKETRLKDIFRVGRKTAVAKGFFYHIEINKRNHKSLLKNVTKVERKVDVRQWWFAVKT